MLKLVRQLGLTVCLAALQGLAWAGPLLVVVPDDSPIRSLTRQELTDIYLDRNAARGITGAVPLDRTEDALRERYYRDLGLSLSAVRSHWARRVFTGRGRPPAAVSAAQLSAALHRQGTTLVYVEASERPAHTRIVATLE